MATPSQQTNQILELLQRSSPPDWGTLEELLKARLQASEQTREEFETKARVRGEAFLSAAESRLTLVRQGFEDYRQALENLLQSVKQQDSDRLQERATALQSATLGLFQSLDAYAAYYFSWGESQSPLVTVIRQAVESYSRSALQSTQAQRILQQMNEELGVAQRPGSQSSSKENPDQAGQS